MILGFSTSIKLPLEAGFKKGSRDGCVILQNGKFSATSCDKKSSRTPEGLDTKVGYICEKHNPCEVWSFKNYYYMIINPVVLSVLLFVNLMFSFSGITIERKFWWIRRWKIFHFVTRIFLSRWSKIEMFANGTRMDLVKYRKRSRAHSCDQPHFFGLLSILDRDD